MPMRKYKTILADPPWQQTMSGIYKNPKNKRPETLNYPTMTLDEICNMPIKDFADFDCHLWLWTTNEFLEAGFKVMRDWGFTYLAPIIWKKPSGMGNYFIHLTQTLLFGYKDKCLFHNSRYLPNFFEANTPKEHSRKPRAAYDLIEKVSSEPRLEIFARPLSPMFPKLPGWDVWGNEVESDIKLELAI